MNHDRGEGLVDKFVPAHPQPKAVFLRLSSDVDQILGIYANLGTILFIIILYTKSIALCSSLRPFMNIFLISILDSITFTQGMQDQFMPLGKSLHFSCKVTGLPTPSITWLKDGTAIPKSNRILLNRSLLPSNILSSDLQLNLVSNRDEGIYQCVAKNLFEEKVMAARLVVGGKKEVKKFLIIINYNN